MIFLSWSKRLVQGRRKIKIWRTKSDCLSKNWLISNLIFIWSSSRFCKYCNKNRLKLTWWTNLVRLCLLKMIFSFPSNPNVSVFVPKENSLLAPIKFNNQNQASFLIFLIHLVELYNIMKDSWQLQENSVLKYNRIFRVLRLILVELSKAFQLRINLYKEVWIGLSHWWKITNKKNKNYK